LSLNLTYSDKLEKIAKYYPEQVTNNLRAYTKEEISKLLSVADLRDRCLILLMSSLLLLL
ncbi:MAG: hypothetical protein ACJ709_05060, partial [Nitrososphaeraceae archaeon]